MGRYREEESCEKDDNALGGTALGFGIGGVAAAVPALIMSIIGLVRDGRRHQAEMLATRNSMTMAEVAVIAEKCAVDQATIAQLRGEKYTDAAVLGLYKQQTQSENAMQTGVNTNFKEVYQTLAALDKQEAVNAAENRCLVKQVDRIGGVVEKLSAEMCDMKAREAVTAERVTTLATTTATRFETVGREFHAALKCLGNETSAAIGREADQRICGDDNNRLWVESQNYMQGQVYLNPHQICGRRGCCNKETTGTPAS